MEKEKTPTNISVSEEDQGILLNQVYRFLQRIGQEDFDLIMAAPGQYNRHDFSYRKKLNIPNTKSSITIDPLYAGAIRAFIDFHYCTENEIELPEDIIPVCPTENERLYYYAMMSFYRAFAVKYLKENPELEAKCNLFIKKKDPIRAKAQREAHIRKQELLTAKKTPTTANAIVQKELEDNPEYKGRFENWTKDNWRKFLHITKTKSES